MQMHGCDRSPIGRFINLSNWRRFQQPRHRALQNSMSFLPRAFSRRSALSPRCTSGSVIDNRITIHTSARPHATSVLSNKTLLFDLQHHRGFKSRDDLLAFIQRICVPRGESALAKDYSSPRRSLPGLMYHAPVMRINRAEFAHHLREKKPSILHHPCVAIHHPRDHLFLIAAAILPPETLLHLVRVQSPCRATPRRAEGCAPLREQEWTTWTSRYRVRNRPQTHELFRRERASDWKLGCMEWRQNARTYVAAAHSLPSVAYTRRAYWLESAVLFRVARDHLVLARRSILNSPRAFPRRASPWKRRNRPVCCGGDAPDIIKWYLSQCILFKCILFNSLFSRIWFNIYLFCFCHNIFLRVIIKSRSVRDKLEILQMLISIFDL